MASMESNATAYSHWANKEPTGDDQSIPPGSGEVVCQDELKEPGGVVITLQRLLLLIRLHYLAQFGGMDGVGDVYVDARPINSLPHTVLSGFLSMVTVMEAR